MTWTSKSVLDALAENREQLRKFGVQKIGLFGSYSRNAPSPDSDMDFLVTLERNTFGNYMGLKLFLEDYFGHQVDLVMEESLRPELRPYVTADVRYAA